MDKKIWQAPLVMKLDIENVTQGNGGAGFDFASESSV
jgi:hypothetical protein